MVNILLIIDLSVLRTILLKGIFKRFERRHGLKLTVLALNAQKKSKTYSLCS